PRLAQVGVDQQNLLPHFGDRDPQVAHHGGFSLRGPRARQDQHLGAAPVFSGEQNRNQQRSKRLSHHRRLPLPGDQLNGGADPLLRSRPPGRLNKVQIPIRRRRQPFPAAHHPPQPLQLPRGRLRRARRNNPQLRQIQIK